MVEGLAGGSQADVVGNAFGGGFWHAVASDMGRDQDALMEPERALVGKGFGRENVEGGAFELPLV